jgi:hypothetical protein
MATFNLPSSPDVYDDATGLVNPTRPPRTTDPAKLTGQAFRLIAIELAFSFLSAFAQYRFHDIDLRRPFDGDGERGDEDENLSRDEKKQKTKETNAKRSRLEDEKKPFFFGVKNVFSLSLDKNRHPRVLRDGRLLRDVRRGDSARHAVDLRGVSARAPQRRAFVFLLLRAHRVEALPGRPSRGERGHTGVAVRLAAAHEREQSRDRVSAIEWARSEGLAARRSIRLFKM